MPVCLSPQLLFHLTLRARKKHSAIPTAIFSSAINANASVTKRFSKTRARPLTHGHLMKTNAPLYSLNGGEVSKIALARVDVAKLRMAAECQLNWLPFVVGPMMLRPGLEYVGEMLGDAAGPLIRFGFSQL